MKKIFALSFAVLILMSLFCSCKEKVDENIVATVGEQKIYIEQIDEYIAFAEIRNAANTKYINQTFYENERQKQLEKVLLPTERDEVIEELIEGRVIREEAKKSDVFIDYDKAKSSADSEYSLLKTDTTQKEFYDILVSELNAREIDEEEYLSMHSDYCYDFYNSVALKQDFGKTKFNSKSDDSLDEQFEYYVEDLVDKYSVKIYK